MVRVSLVINNQWGLSYLQEEEEDYDEEGEDEMTATSDPVEIVGKIGKAPVFLKCELCGVVLPSILCFTRHMKREHKGSDLERDRPFKCDLCSHEFYFASSLNSHKSKAHFETSGTGTYMPWHVAMHKSKTHTDRLCNTGYARTGGTGIWAINCYLLLLQGFEAGL